jgi:hypothetical protein
MLLTQRPVQHTDSSVQNLIEFPNTCAPQGLSVTVPGLGAALLSLTLLFPFPLSFSRFSSLGFSTLRARILKLLVAYDLSRS